MGANICGNAFFALTAFADGWRRDVPPLPLDQTVTKSLVDVGPIPSRGGREREGEVVEQTKLEMTTTTKAASVREGFAEMAPNFSSVSASFSSKILPFSQSTGSLFKGFKGLLTPYAVIVYDRLMTD